MVSILQVWSNPMYIILVQFQCNSLVARYGPTTLSTPPIWHLKQLQQMHISRKCTTRTTLLITPKRRPGNFWDLILGCGRWLQIYVCEALGTARYHCERWVFFLSMEQKKNAMHDFDAQKTSFGVHLHGRWKAIAFLMFFVFFFKWVLYCFLLHISSLPFHLEHTQLQAPAPFTFEQNILWNQLGM